MKNCEEHPLIPIWCMLKQLMKTVKTMYKNLLF